MSAIALPQIGSIRELKGIRRIGSVIKLAVFYLVLIGAGGAFMVPYVFALFGSLKPISQIQSEPPWIPPSPVEWSNYTHTLFSDPQVQTDFIRYLGNTAMVTAILTVGQVFFSMLAAYAFARIPFPGRDAIFWVYLMTLMVPNIVTIIPLYAIMHFMRLINTYWAIFLPYVFGTPYTIFLMRQFFRTIPQEVLDAGKIDGCGDFAALWRIVIPLSRPVLVTAGLIAFVFSWNNFLWPLVVTGSQSHYLLTTGLANFASSPGLGEYWNFLLAGAMITLIPMIILFAIFNRTIVRSVQLGVGR
jgi:multiple sugar transport system permease protein